MARDTYEDVDQADSGARPDNLANGVVIVTTIVLLAACVVMQQALKKHWNGGMFADKTAPAVQ
jgi:hypothetical protein